MQLQALSCSLPLALRVIITGCSVSRPEPDKAVHKDNRPAAPVTAQPAVEPAPSGRAVEARHKRTRGADGAQELSAPSALNEVGAVRVRPIAPPLLPRRGQRQPAAIR